MSTTAPDRQYPAIAVRDLVRRGREVGEAVRQVEQHGGRYLLTRHGAPVAGLVPLKDIDVLAALDRAEGYDLEQLKREASRATATAAPSADAAEENPR